MQPARGEAVMLVAARAFQRLGGALIFAPGLAIIADAFPRTERGRALGLNAVVFAIGTSFGPTLGGLITEHLTWRWIFYINLPLGAAGFIASSRLLVRSEARTRQPLDLLGSVLIAVGLSLLTVTLSFGQEWGWASGRLLTCLAIAIVALVAAIHVEQRARRPIVDLALFRQPVLASSLGSMMLAMLALFAVSFVLPFYFEELRGFSVASAGLLLTPLPLTIAVVAGLGGASAGVTLAAARDGAVSPTHVVALQHTFLAAFRGALLACAALGAVGVLAALVRGQDRGIAR